MVLAVPIAAAMSGCGSGGASLVVPPGASLVAEEGYHVGPGQPQVYGSGGVVCLDQSGSVRVESVQPVAPTGGFHVQEFVVQKNPWATGHSSIGAQSGTLKHAGLLKDNLRTLTAVCNARTGAGYVVDIQVAYTRGRVGHADGFEVDYVSGGRQQKMFIAKAVTLCAGQGHEPACERMSSQLHSASQLAEEAARHSSAG